MTRKDQRRLQHLIRYAEVYGVNRLRIMPDENGTIEMNYDWLWGGTPEEKERRQRRVKNLKRYRLHELAKQVVSWALECGLKPNSDHTLGIYLIDLDRAIQDGDLGTIPKKVLIKMLRVIAGYAAGRWERQIRQNMEKEEALLKLWCDIFSYQWSDVEADLHCEIGTDLN